MSTAANLALEGGDPRDPVHSGKHSDEKTQNKLVHFAHDPTVTFEEYCYYASITRAEEKAADALERETRDSKTVKSIIKNRFSKGYSHKPAPNQDVLAENGSEKEPGSIDGQKRNWGDVSDAEWRQASRATRTAGWSAVFFLITTDILGPFSVP